jgi:hypothetical protein
LEENYQKPKKSTVISVLVGAMIGAILGIVAYNGNWLG